MSITDPGIFIAFGSVTGATRLPGLRYTNAGLLAAANSSWVGSPKAGGACSATGAWAWAWAWVTGCAGACSTTGV